MRHTALTHRTGRPEKGLAFLDGLSLKHSRAHEAVGPARHLLALLVAGAAMRTTAGPVFWVAPSWGAAQPYGPGMARFADPGRFIFVRAQRAQDVLWTLEEVMRSGASPLVVGDLPAPPGLTPVRRLHLAGATGAAHGAHAPITLLLNPTGAAPGVESRWHMAPMHGPGASGEAWRLTRSRTRNGRAQSWQVLPAEAGLALSPAALPEGLENF